jgi:hypothetical protein
MTSANQTRDHQARCRPHLLRLRLIARGEASTTSPSQVTAEIRDATNAILAEADAAIRTALTATDNRLTPATETFLLARLARLADAADEAVNAARDGHPPTLRSRLRRFDELTSAIWTVQDAVCGPVPLPRPHPNLPEHHPGRTRRRSPVLAADRTVEPLPWAWSSTR